MPIVRKLESDLWEVRPHVTDGIARIICTLVGRSMVLLHGFVKKSQRIPANDLHTARQRLKLVQED